MYFIALPVRVLAPMVSVMAHLQRHLMSFPQKCPWFSPCASAPPIGFVRCKLNMLHSIDGADAHVENQEIEGKSE